jgi:uncharacterized membrane protein
MNRRWIGAVIIGAMLAFTLTVWHGLPDTIPTHWDLNGEVNGRSPRWPGAFVAPGIALAIWLLLPLLRRLDPRRDNYERFDETFFLLLNVIVLFVAVVHTLTLSVALGWDVDVSRAMSAMIGVMFVVMGNFLPRIRSNWWMGVRTPWTLDNERVWRETHRLAGWTFVAGGCLAVLGSFLPAPYRTPVMLTGLIGGGLVPVVASYVFWRREQREGEA